MNITEWLTWFLGCLDRAIEQSNQITSSVLEKEQFWKALKLKKVFLNDRQTKDLNKLFSGFEGKLTREKWMKMTKAPEGAFELAMLACHDAASPPLVSGCTDPVSRRRYGVAEPPREGVARSLETGPFVPFMESGNRHQFALVEPD